MPAASQPHAGGKPAVCQRHAGPMPEGCLHVIVATSSQIMFRLIHDSPATGFIGILSTFWRVNFAVKSSSANWFVNHPYPFLRSRGIQFAHSHEQMHPTVRLLRPVFDGPRNDGRLGGGFYASLPLIDSSNATAVICSTPRNPFSPEGEFSSHQISLAHG